MAAWRCVTYLKVNILTQTAPAKMADKAKGHLTWSHHLVKTRGGWKFNEDEERGLKGRRLSRFISSLPICLLLLPSFFSDVHRTTRSSLSLRNTWYCIYKITLYGKGLIFWHCLNHLCPQFKSWKHADETKLKSLKHADETKLKV